MLVLSLFVALGSAIRLFLQALGTLRRALLALLRALLRIPALGLVLVLFGLGLGNRSRRLDGELTVDGLRRRFRGRRGRPRGGSG
ncbi:MAG: hypothetical protein ACRDN6_06830, partial [Gaiellaceae bacterium]